MNNMFCSFDDIHNEADVESLFIDRLLRYLNYSDDSVRRKDSLSNLVVGGMRGLPQREYRPDYAIKKHRRIRWIIEAKAPDEDLDHHIWQAKGYCMLINGEYHDSNPTQFYVLTNAKKHEYTAGIGMRIYLRWILVISKREILC